MFLFIMFIPAITTGTDFQNKKNCILPVRADNQISYVFLPKDTIAFTLEISVCQELIHPFVISFGLQTNKKKLIPVEIMEPQTGDTASSLTIEMIQSGSPKSVYVQLKIPSNQLTWIQESFQGFSKSFQILAWIDHQKASPIWITDVNIVNLPGRYIQAHSQENRFTKLDWYADLSRRFVHHTYGASIKTSTYARFNNNGVSTGVHSKTSLTLLENTVQLSQVDASTLLTPHQKENSYVDIDFQYLGKSIWTDHWTDSSDIMSGKNKRTFIKDIYEDQLLLIGILPVQLRAGGYGELGIEWQVKLDQTKHQALTTQFTPLVDIAGYARIDIALERAFGHIDGALRLISNRFTTETSAQMFKENNQLEAVISCLAENDLNGPDGNLVARIFREKLMVCLEEQCLFDICTEIPIPCIEEVNAFLPLVDWQSWQSNSILIDSFGELYENQAMIILP